MTSSTPRLQSLRALMKKRDLAAYIVPSEDAHQSEYISACDGRREFISGFDGSAGLAVVTLESAALWTDGRYFLQASKQLDANWTLMKSGLPGVPTKEEWLNQTLAPKSLVGIDASLITYSDYSTLKSQLKGDRKISLLAENLVDAVWGNARPPRPSNSVSALPVKYSGESVSSKISRLQEELRKNNTCAFLVSALDEIAWLFNLRGSDIPMNPVFFAYAIVHAERPSVLYIRPDQLTPEASKALADASVSVKGYGDILDGVRELASPSNSLWIDPRCPMSLVLSLGSDELPSNCKKQRSPITTAKAIKNSVELDGFRACHVRDGAALVTYFSWLENELLHVKNVNITEVSAASHLEKIRSRQTDFMGLSFDTISGAGPNGAIIHYHPHEATCSIIKKEEMYLCDSGAQYRDGTTDVTRTLHFTQPTAHERKTYTLVLKGHVALSRAVFPKGTSGYLLDLLARMPLWSVGLNYRHGTGHGVGHFLNVHEGPQGIGTRIAYNDVELEPGMVVTNEPGYYEDGAFGIRIENVVIVKKVNTPFTFGDVPYYGFEDVTMAPYCRKLIDTTLLTPEEIDHVNAYHAKVYENLKPLLSGDKLALEYLTRETRPL